MERNQLAEAIKVFERPHEEFRLSVSFGHLLVYQQNLSAVPYDGEQGILSLLDYLERLGWQKIYSEDEICIGAKKGREEIQIGYGGQLNWVYREFILINELDRAYLEFVEGLFDELKRRDQVLLANGHQPVSLANDIKPIPTAEAKAIYDYTEDNLKLRDYFMCAAMTKVSFQFAHSDNFQKRFQAALIIQPALAALMDNVSWVGGEENNSVLLNLNHLKTAVDELYVLQEGLSHRFKYDEMAEFLMKAPAIMASQSDELKYVGNMSVEETYSDVDLTEADISKIFRLSQSSLQMSEDGLTLANVDTVPYPLNMAYVLMVKALLYNPDHITALEKMLEELHEDKLLQAHESVLEKGLAAKFGNGSASDLVKDLFFMITLSVEPGEQHYLQPFNSLLFKDIKTKQVGARQFSAMLGE